jgi:hypothetical protein
VFWTVLFVDMAVGVFAFIGRRSRRPRQTFTTLSVVALILSLIPNILLYLDPSPAAQYGLTSEIALYLILFHFLAFFVTVGVLNSLGLEPRHH